MYVLSQLPSVLLVKVRWILTPAGEIICCVRVLLGGMYIFSVTQYTRDISNQNAMQHMHGHVVWCGIVPLRTLADVFLATSAIDSLVFSIFLYKSAYELAMSRLLQILAGWE